MIPNSRQLIALASRCVARLWERDHAIYQPIWHLVLPDGRQEILTHGWTDKDADAAAMRAEFKERGVVAYALVVEAWTLNGPKPSPEELQRIGREGLLWHPRKQEAVCYQAEDQAGTLCAEQEIERRPGQPARLLPIRWLEAIDQEGRFAAMLPRQGSLH